MNTQKAHQPNRNEQHAEFLPNITTITRREKLHSGKIREGKDTLWLIEGTTPQGETWRYYQIVRILKDTGQFELPCYGWCRVNKS